MSYNPNNDNLRVGDETAGADEPTDEPEPTDPAETTQPAPDSTEDLRPPTSGTGTGAPEPPEPEPEPAPEPEPDPAPEPDMPEPAPDPMDDPTDDPGAPEPPGGDIPEPPEDSGPSAPTDPDPDPPEAPTPDDPTEAPGAPEPPGGDIPEPPEPDPEPDPAPADPTDTVDVSDEQRQRAADRFDEQVDVLRDVDPDDVLVRETGDGLRAELAPEVEREVRRRRAAEAFASEVPGSVAARDIVFEDGEARLRDERLEDAIAAREGIDDSRVVVGPAGAFVRPEDAGPTDELTDARTDFFDERREFAPTGPSAELGDERAAFADARDVSLDDVSLDDVLGDQPGQGDPDAADVDEAVESPAMDEQMDTAPRQQSRTDLGLGDSGGSLSTGESDGVGATLNAAVFAASTAAPGVPPLNPRTAAAAASALGAAATAATFDQTELEPGDLGADPELEVPRRETVTEVSIPTSASESELEAVDPQPVSEVEPPTGDQSEITVPTIEAAQTIGQTEAMREQQRERDETVTRTPTRDRSGDLLPDELLPDEEVVIGSSGATAADNEDGAPVREDYEPVRAFGGDEAAEPAEETQPELDAEETELPTISEIGGPDQPLTPPPVIDEEDGAGVDPIQEPEVEPGQEPTTQEPTQTPTTEPGEVPEITPITDPGTEPITEPGTEPITEPIETPETTPETTPITEPVEPPVTETPEVAEPTVPETELVTEMPFETGAGTGRGVSRGRPTQRPRPPFGIETSTDPTPDAGVDVADQRFTFDVTLPTPFDDDDEGRSGGSRGGGFGAETGLDEPVDVGLGDDLDLGLEGVLDDR